MRAFVRRRLVADWRLQGRLWLHAALYGAGMLLAVSVGLFGPLLWGHSAEPGGDAERALVLLWLHEHYWPLLAACAAILAIGGAHLAQRIAGPLVGYRRNLRRLADGQFGPPVRSRLGDYLTEELVGLNAAVDGVAARVDAIRKAQLALRREVAALLDRVDADGETVRALAGACDELDERVRAFRRVDAGDPASTGERTAAVAAAVARPGSA